MLRILIFLLFATNSFAQQKDHRAVLNVNGGLDEISVSPDERIWMVTSNGSSYAAENIHALWHTCAPGYHAPEYRTNAPNLERISFFNRDTAIITGYIPFDSTKYTKNGYYRTTDGGKSWQLLNYGGNEWIYTAFSNANGHAWMGGSSGSIFYSPDYGATWDKLNSPYDGSTRLHCIFMRNNIAGISGGLSNLIYITNDNWMNSSKIETPFDQKLYKAPEGYSDNRILKILMWKEFYVVNQSNHIYYTHRDKISWQKFSADILDFCLDSVSQKLYGVTADHRVLEFNTPSDYHDFSSTRLPGKTMDIRIVNHAFYFLTYDSGGRKFGKLTPDSLIINNPFTTEYKIGDLAHIAHGKQRNWGASGNHLYLSDNDQLDWYREAVLDFQVSSLYLLNDSTAILWDNNRKKNFLYSLNNHSCVPYAPANPLQSFLEAPVTQFTLTSNSAGCFHYTRNEVRYQNSGSGDFKVTHQQHGNALNGDTSSYTNTVKAKTVNDVLSGINARPYAIPTMKEFQITPADIKAYRKLVDDRIKKGSDYDYSYGKKIDKEFYYAVPARLDTLSDSLLTRILMRTGTGFSTTSNWYYLEFINANNDTLCMQHRFYIHNTAWNLPWTMELNGLYFACYSLELSRFVDANTPDDFLFKSSFTNADLIMVIADYLWSRED